MEPVADLSQVMTRMLVSTHVPPQAVQMMYPSQSRHEQEDKPYIVRGERLRQNGKRCNHKMNLLYEALQLLSSIVITLQAVILSQGDISGMAGRPIALIFTVA